MTTKATPTREQAPGETLNHAVDCRGRLAATELLTGTPTVVSSPTGPTISNIQVNSATISINGVDVIAGKAVLFTVSGLTLDTSYTITVTGGTDSTPAETIVGTLQLDCRI